PVVDAPAELQPALLAPRVPQVPRAVPPVVPVDAMLPAQAEADLLGHAGIGWPLGAEPELAGLRPGPAPATGQRPDGPRLQTSTLVAREVPHEEAAVHEVKDRLAGGLDQLRGPEVVDDLDSGESGAPGLELPAQLGRPRRGRGRPRGLLP